MRNYVPALVLLMVGACGTDAAMDDPSDPPLDEDPGLPTGRVLILIANDGFYYQEYGDPRAVLEQAGYTVTVAAATTAMATPHTNSGQTGDGQVAPDLRIDAAVVADYDALVISGGWGASMYQFAFTGSVDNPAWARNEAAATAANARVGEMLASGKYVLGICHGISVLAYARIDGASPLSGRTITASEGGSPAQFAAGMHYSDDMLPSRWHAEQNGANVLAPSSVGNTGTDTDDVVVAGHILTAQNQHAAEAGAEALVALLPALP